MTLTSSALEEIALLEQKRRNQKNLPHLYGQKFYPWSREFFESRSKDTLLLCGNQVGKMERCVTPISTPNGWAKAGDIKESDIIFDERGNPTKVTRTFPQRNKPFFKITFDDGSTGIWGDEHRWKCQTAKNRFKKFKRDGTQYEGFGEWQVLNTLEIIEKGGYSPLAKNAKAKVAIPVCEPVKYPEKDLGTNPYVMGAMIGDGHFESGTIINGDLPILERVYDLVGSTQRGIVPAEGKKAWTMTIPMDKFNRHSCTAEHKEIPEEYLTASVEQRLDLLRGLMDTDGSISRGHVIEYSSASEKLIDQMVELINSLGGVINSRDERPTWYNYKGERLTGQKSYRIRFKMQINPFYTPRKADQWRKDIRYKHQRLIEKIEYVGKEDGICFEVDSPDRTYLSGKEYIVTHNTSIQLRKMIHWATATELWEELWGPAIRMGKTPNVFWFLITDYNTATSLYHDKLVPEFLPRNEMRNDPKYGWKPNFRNRQIHSIEFNSGVTIYFHAYSKQASTLQSSTVYAIFTDEELPEGIHGELKFRTAAVDGYFNMVFTATMGQELWYRAFERIGEKDESFLKARKIRATVFDCLQYEDGDTNTPWTREKIKELELSCSTENEIQKRVYGRFVVDEGLVLSEFVPSKHMIEPHDIDPEWLLFSGVDIGSGGKSGHKGAFVFLAVKPDYTEGVIFKGWKGNEQETTTAADILDKYREKRGSLKMDGQYYDWASKDFYTHASRAGETFLKANKDHKQGWDMLNTLLKLGMLHIFDIDELQPIRYEAGTLTHESLGVKRHANDDILDGCRYCISSVPWDISKVVKMFDDGSGKKVEVIKTDTQLRREMVFGDGSEEEYVQNIEEELDEWNEMYDC